MSAYIALTCPDCGRATVYNGRGYCQCRSYHIIFWKGMNHGRRAFLPHGRIWIWEDIEHPKLYERSLSDRKMGGINNASL